MKPIASPANNVIAFMLAMLAARGDSSGPTRGATRIPSRQGAATAPPPRQARVPAMTSWPGSAGRLSRSAGHALIAVALRLG
jgi:hypothetical protein